MDWKEELGRIAENTARNKLKQILRLEDHLRIAEIILKRIDSLEEMIFKNPD